MNFITKVYHINIEVQLIKQIFKKFSHLWQIQDKYTMSI